MPSTIETKTAEERITELEEKLEDLAGFVGRVTAGIFGENFHKKYDSKVAELLVWTESVFEQGTEDECVVGWWEYRGPNDMAEEARVAG